MKPATLLILLTLCVFTIQDDNEGERRLNRLKERS